MRYTLLMNYAQPAPGEIPQEAIRETQDAFGAYGRALEEAGVLVAAEVLTPTASSTTLTCVAARWRCRTDPSPRRRRPSRASSSSTCPTWTPPSAGRRSAPVHSSGSWRSAPAGPPSSMAPGRPPARCDRAPRPARTAPRKRAALVRAELAARTSYGRLLALLAAGTHDIAGAEDALADAFERALRTWPVDGVPDRPDAWLLTVARNRQRDTWRSAEATRTVPPRSAGPRPGPPRRGGPRRRARPAARAHARLRPPRDRRG